ncbi:ATP-binding cassette domain-containing protein [Oscillibacter sp. MSJ-2]|uniref:ATP-binding cassette domain-containing protein n=1 Tax=Dysosmobacter acutus TaxID=2841504 RepID=A0ABS6F510_9FIRM|nr:ATP-binding cassette domain-containing protein [Dysosmobacter acutus]MBU5625383.1 ATP-binding cassette domain-containing protein [Dysosmobacter acutus]
MLSVDIQKRLGDFQLQVQFETGSSPLALLGASGCGKSVTLRCIAGILRPDEGKIILNGRTLFDSAGHIDLPPQRRKVGYLFQQYALFPNMTVRQNIAVAAQKGRRKETTAELLRRFHLEDVAEHRPSQISGGQQQRTALARILSSEPEAILLDEPLSALDLYLRRQLEEELRCALTAFSATSVWVTHDQGEACRSCRQVCVMESGAAFGARPMEEFFADPVSVSAARLSGCENLVGAVPRGTEVEIPLWGITLRRAAPAAPETTALGLRMQHLRLAREGVENSFACSVVQSAPEAFSDLLTLRPLSAAPEAPLLHMEAEKGRWAAGDLLYVSVAPEHVLTLR